MDDTFTRELDIYKKAIKRYERDTQKWTRQSKDIQRRYKDDRENNFRENRFFQYNVLWSNVQTLQPALYAKDPKPNVSRRFDNKDTVGRVAADVLERCLNYVVSCDNYGQVIRQCVLDYLLSGRGTPWVRYVPTLRPMQDAANDDIQITNDATLTDEPEEELAYEEAVVDYVYWDDFGCSIARTWAEVDCVWRRVFLTKEKVVERFGVEKAKLVPLDHKDTANKSEENKETSTGGEKATIYELWCKNTKKVYWLHKEVDAPLDERKDPLLLKDFFPCPRPLLANVINDSVIPIPDYIEYQDQARQLDDYTNRIGQMARALKVAGIYDASAQGIQRLLSEDVQNQLIPIDKWAMFAEKGGLKGAIDFLPIQDIAQTLLYLYEAREKVKQDLYEITGIADIIRGATNAVETATAQQLKGQFATLRLSERQSEIQRFARDVLRLLGEIMASKFDVQTFKKISGIQLLNAEEKQQAMMLKQMQPEQPLGDIEELLDEPTWDEVMGLLRDEPGMMFRIDIETDSTIKADQQQDKADRIEFLAAVGNFIKQGTEAAAVAPDLVPLLGKMLMFGIRGFKVGKNLESSFEEWVTQSEDNFKQAQGQPPKPDPEMAKIQAQQQIEQQKMQNMLTLETEKAKISMQLERDKQSAQNADNQREQQLSAAREQQKMQNEMTLQRYKVESESQMELQRIAAETERAIAVERIKAETAITVAQISAQQAMQSAQLNTAAIREPQNT